MSVIPFDPFALPLSGTTLIEAAAGTGKTYTIALLYLRLLIERKLSVDNILVVTYTRAATAELRSRIRSRLHELSRLIDSPAPLASENALSHFIPADQSRRRSLRIVVEAALRNFDEASIYTIHGFCQRVLQEHAFESGLVFDAELLQDQREMAHTAVMDFWREKVLSRPESFQQMLHEAGVGVSALEKLVNSSVGAQLPTIRCDEPPQQSKEELDSHFEALVEQLRALWPQTLEWLEQHQTRFSRSKKAILSAAERMSALLQAPVFDRGEFCGKKSPTVHLNGEKVGGFVGTVHGGIELIDALKSSAAQIEGRALLLIANVKRECIEDVHRRLTQAKTRAGVQFFDDLLSQLNEALSGPAGERIAASMLERYPAALIDEFQDTDELQYRILQAVYLLNRGTLFLIGDPKQSIYRFRGADIFAYMKARTSAGSQVYTLQTNYRSEPGLLRAINQLFDNSRTPFLFEDAIQYHPVDGSADWQTRPHLVDTAQGGEAQMRFWYLPRAGDAAKLLSREAARERLCHGVGAEIVRLTDIAAGARIAGSLIRPGDIAILVFTHYEAEQMRLTLERMAIPSVVSGLRSVFASPQAAMLQTLLNAIVFAENDGYLRSALLTDFFALSASQIGDCGDEGLELWRERFRELHELWKHQGFIQMFRRLLASQNVAARLLGHLGGERTLTNVLHLMELVNTELSTRRMNMFDTLSWFEERCVSAQGSAAADEELIRLESDTNRVQIITIHKSKGLQFPVVFCPFMWEDRSTPRDGEEVQYHDPQQQWQRVLDLNPDSWSRFGELMEDELQAEALRLLYVALTRAVHRCYIGYGAIRGFERSALAYLLHQQPGEQRQWRAVAQRLGDEADERLRGDIVKLCASCGQSAMLQELPQTTALYEGARIGGAGELHARTLTQAVPRSWKVTSYTALTHVHGHADEPLVREPERPDNASTIEEAPPGTIFAFARGALAGTMLHAIFEQIDFTAPAEQIALTVEALCGRYGFDTSWGPVLLKTILAVLEAPLPHTRALRTITAPQRLVEMEFYFPLEGLDAERLNGVLGAMASEHPAVAAGIPFSFDTIRGFMKGFIDLVFCDGQRYYIADYKSNYLGPQSSYYSQDALLGAMCESRYGLQYAIYTVALHRYLKIRLADYDYQRHFGGVYYLFLRGIEDDATDCRGIFYDRISLAHVEALSDCFGQTGERL